MHNILYIPISINELESLVYNVVRKALLECTVQNAMHTETDQFLTIKQASELIFLKVSTIYGLVHRAEIPVCKTGKRLYFSKKELTEWVKTGKRKTNSELETEANIYINKLRQTVQK